MFGLAFVVLNNIGVFGFISSAATGYRYILFSTALRPKLGDVGCWSRTKWQQLLISYLAGCVSLRICPCICDGHLFAVCLSVLVEVLIYSSEMTSSKQLDPFSELRNFSCSECSLLSLLSVYTAIVLYYGNSMGVCRNFS